jgi:hypothetical protein
MQSKCNVHFCIFMTFFFCAWKHVGSAKFSKVSAQVNLICFFFLQVNIQSTFEVFCFLCLVARGQRKEISSSQEVVSCYKLWQVNALVHLRHCHALAQCPATSLSSQCHVTIITMPRHYHALAQCPSTFTWLSSQCPSAFASLSSTFASLSSTFASLSMP